MSWQMVAARMSRRIRELSSKRSLSWRGREPLIKGNRINVLLCSGSLRGLQIGRIETPHHLQISRLDPLSSSYPCVEGYIRHPVVQCDLISNDEYPRPRRPQRGIKSGGSIFDQRRLAYVVFATSNKTTQKWLYRAIRLALVNAPGWYSWPGDESNNIIVLDIGPQAQRWYRCTGS